MSESNKSVVRRWFDEVWNHGIETTIEELHPAEGVSHGLGDSDADVHGPAEFRPFLASFRGALPDIHIHLDDILAEGDRVAIRVSVKGTHTGLGLGVPPTGRRVTFNGIIILRVVDGQIVEAWNSYDQLGLLRQIGALPETGGRDGFLSSD